MGTQPFRICPFIRTPDVSRHGKISGSLYDKIVTELGADANAYTTDDYTCYHLNFAAEDLEKVIEMESDRFINLKYSEQDFKTETGAVYGEFLKGRISPWFMLYEKMYDTAFDLHTYKHITMGFEADIKAMPTMYQYSRSFFQRYYRPENVVLLIVGQIETAPTLELIRKYYGTWQTAMCLRRSYQNRSRPPNVRRKSVMAEKPCPC
jgi:zinc protease